MNPTAGCLPLIITWPVFVGLYRCFSNTLSENINNANGIEAGLFNDSFLWLPSLSGPTSIDNRANGLGLSWLWPLNPNDKSSIDIDIISNNEALTSSSNSSSSIFDMYSPPIGWHDALLYLSIPLLLVLSQYASQAIITSINNSNSLEDEGDKNDDDDDDDSSKKIGEYAVKVLPLMVGYFAMNVPAGLGLYWLTNNILTTAQQVMRIILLYR